jgi:hypothetical protein
MRNFKTNHMQRNYPEQHIVEKVEQRQQQQQKSISSPKIRVSSPSHGAQIGGESPV